MVIELIVNRGWHVLVDGKKPQSPWNAPDERGVFDPQLRIKDEVGVLKDLQIGKIVLMRQCGDVVRMEDDWKAEDEFGEMRPRWMLALVHDGVDPIFKNMKITHIVYGGEDSELLITTADGVQHDLDEVTTYIRAEG